MILKRLKLVNYRQHHSLEVKFDGNIILVVGQNGNGKSNLIGALQFALTGEQAGFKKDDLLSWGAQDGSVELWFTHEGYDAHIIRNIATSRAMLEFGKDVYNGITQVNDALRVRVGIDKDMARQAVFVQQGELDDILFTDPSARERSFQKLMGIGDAAKIHKNLGDYLATLSAPANYDEQLADGHVRRREQGQRLTLMQTELTGLDQPGASLNDLQQRLGSETTMLGQLRRGLDLFRAETNQVTVLQSTELEISQVPYIEQDAGTLDKQIQETEQLERDAVMWANALSQFQSAGMAMAALGTAPTTPEVIQRLQTQYKDAQSQVDAARGKLGMYQNLWDSIQRVQGVQECPLCGSQIGDIEQLRVRLSNNMENLRSCMSAPAQQASTAQAEEYRLKRELDQYQRTHQERLIRYTEADKRMTAIKPVTVDLAQVQQQIRELKGSKQALLQASLKRTQLSERKVLLERELERTRSSLADVGRTLVTGSTSFVGQPEAVWTTAILELEQSIRGIQAEQQQVQQRLTRIAALKGSIVELEKTLTTLDNTLAVLELKKAQQGPYRAALEILNKTRDWFHHSNGPRALAGSVLGELNQDVNKFLSQFTAPFTVEPSDMAFGFRCCFTDGRTLPKSGPPDAYVLSGGQRVQLACSFRMASYCMFANKLGLISLDEPTAYLDDANVGRFCDLMVQIKKIAQGMNLQVIMATHEKSLMPFADTVIDLCVKK